MPSPDTILEPSRRIPVLGNYDVVVVGGGPAGVCAGLSASRMGVRTLLVEQFNCLGGMATIGLHQHIGVFMGEGDQNNIVGGIPREIADDTLANWQGEIQGGYLDVEVESFKLQLDQLAAQAGLNLLFYSQVSDALLQDNRLIGVILNNISGRFAVGASCVIDCTGDGLVAFRAGCRMMHGRPEDGKMQPVTLMYRVGGCDRKTVVNYWFRTDAKLRNFCKKAVEQGLMGPWQSELMGFWFNKNRPDQVGVNFTHMHGDGSSAFDMTKASIEGRKQVHEAVRAMRALIPGMENSYLIDTAVMVGVRETRRIFGEYVLTADDIKSMKMFDDSIGLGAAFIDIHNTEGAGMDKKSGFRLPKGGYYSIPYRTLVPEKIDNLLVAGRCHSATHEAAGSTRWMTQCMIMGQAAGTAAALSIRNQTSPRHLDVPVLQHQLQSDGVLLK